MFLCAELSISTVINHVCSSEVNAVIPSKEVFPHKPARWACVSLE